MQRPDGHYRIVPAGVAGSGDRILPNDLLPILLQVRDDGRVSFQLVPRASSLRMYYRPDPAGNGQAFREALPELYKSFGLTGPNETRIHQGRGCLSLVSVEQGK